MQGKFSNLTLSVPDIASHCNQEQENQYNTWKGTNNNNNNGYSLTSSLPCNPVIGINSDGILTSQSKAMYDTSPSTLATSVAMHEGTPMSSTSGGQGSLEPANKGAGWFNGLMGCLRPVWTIIGKATAHDLKHTQSGERFFVLFNKK